MISKDELKNYKKLAQYNLGQAEKDYLQNIILFILYQEIGQELIFKGGTALSKCFGSDRFSEDLDFTVLKKKNFKEIIDTGLKRFLLEYEIEEINTEKSLNLIFRIKGPLYNGSRQSLCKIKLDLSKRENIEIKTVNKKIGYYMDNIPVFEIVCMNLKEMFAEKIRTIYTRNKARDVYDTNFLINRKVDYDLKLINKKLSFYNMKFDMKTFKNKLLEKKDVWEREMKLLVKKADNFKEVYQNIINYFKN